MDSVSVSRGVRLSVDCLRQRDVEVVGKRVRAAALDYPVLAVSSHHHFPAVGQF